MKKFRGNIWFVNIHYAIKYISCILINMYYYATFYFLFSDSYLMLTSIKHIRCKFFVWHFVLVLSWSGCCMLHAKEFFISRENFRWIEFGVRISLEGNNLFIIPSHKITALQKHIERTVIVISASDIKSYIINVDASVKINYT